MIELLGNQKIMQTSIEESLTDKLRDGLRNNLNKFTIDQLKRSGVEVKEVIKGPRKGALTVNPLINLHNSGKLTLQEFAAGTYYQTQFGISNRSLHSRPGSYDTPVSLSFKEGGPNQEKMEAGRYIDKVKTHLSLAANYETKWVGGKPKLIEQKLPEILFAIFEKEFAIDNIEKSLKLGHRAIRDRIKKICEILLDIQPKETKVFLRMQKLRS